jgi:carbonic anhydrase/acetyltransferase-like protein (isoleucine patch superfamily)
MQDWAQRYVIGSAVPVTGKYKGDVEIGNAVWIGDSVIILPGVKVGDGAIIGAGSVVTKSVPAFSVAVGNPARVVKTRFPQEIVDVLSGVKWWHWDERLLRARRKLFEIDLSAVSAAELTDILVGLGVK